jgi:hypothetical protein
MSNQVQQGAVIDSITDLMLSDFIVCLTKQDYACLANGKNGVTPEELSQAWDNIYSQYLDETDDSEQRAYMSLSKDAAVLEIKIQIIQGCIEVLRLEHRPEIVEELRKWMPVFEKFDAVDKEQYLKDIEAVEMRSAELRVDLRHIQHELADVAPADSEPISALSFERILTRLMIHHNQQMNKFTLSVASFAFMLKDYRNAIIARREYDQ